MPDYGQMWDDISPPNPIEFPVEHAVACLKLTLEDVREDIKQSVSKDFYRGELYGIQQAIELLEGL